MLSQMANMETDVQVISTTNDVTVNFLLIKPE
jgi:hypothetical protein